MNPAGVKPEIPHGDLTRADAPSWTRAITYGLPACAIAGPSFLIQSYFLNFATDVLLLAPAVMLAGGAVALGRFSRALD